MQGFPDRSESRRPTMNVSILPPCKVCGDKSTGLHYGATTCESCKAFFLRCMQRKRKIKCSEDASCQIHLRAAKESKCTRCRLERCLAAGMSKDASKIGRHSHNAKAMFIKEARAIEIQKAQQQINPENLGMDLAEGFNINLSEAASASPVRCPTEHVDEELEARIKHITQVYYQNTDCTPEFQKGMAQREKQFMEEKEFERKMFGERRTMPAEEYIRARRETGLDIDGRQEMVDRVNKIADTLAQQLINFGKAIPGFTDLDLEDQTSVVKNAARNGAYVLLRFKMFNMEKELFHGLDGIIFDREKAYKLYSKEMIDTLMPVLRKIHNMNLTDEELVMSAAVCMLLADQYVLNEPQKVERCLDSCLECLIYLIEKNHGADNIRLANIIRIITEMRTVSYHMGTAKEYQETFNLEFNQLWHEMWNV